MIGHGAANYGLGSQAINMDPAVGAVRDQSSTANTIRLMSWGVAAVMGVLVLSQLFGGGKGGRR